jgi:hypothetical protein
MLSVPGGAGGFRRLRLTHRNPTARATLMRPAPK